jgi:hypothetical protein
MCMAQSRSIGMAFGDMLFRAVLATSLVLCSGLLAGPRHLSGRRAAYISGMGNSDGSVAARLGRALA